MSKLVYLHELDSVRRSPSEIPQARKALFEEIVHNGNTVVITFNQLTDSKAFLGLVTKDDDMLETIKKLMLNGSIKISRYSDKRTASQYLQDNLLPTAAGSHGKFVMSGWDIPESLSIEERERIADGIYRALRNSDPDLMDQYLQDKSGPSDSRTSSSPNSEDPYDGAIQRMKRLVQLMLAISSSPLSYVDATEGPHPTFTDMLGLIRKHASTHASEDAWGLIDASTSKLSRMDRQKRSAYYRVLDDLQRATSTTPRTAAEEAIRILDLAYNLTTEASIRGASNHFIPADEESMQEEIQQRLDDYAASYRSSGHLYPWSMSHPTMLGEESPSLQDWQHALRIRQAVGSSRSHADPKDDHLVLIYEASRTTSIKAWRRRVAFSLLRNIMTMLLYAVVLGLVEVVTSLLQDMMTSGMDMGTSTASDLMSSHGSMVAITIFFAGMYVFSRTKKDRLPPYAIFAFLAMLFFVILPLLSCVAQSTGADEKAPTFDLSLFWTNILIGLPSFIASFIGILIFSWVGWIIETKTDMPGIIDSSRAAWESCKDLAAFFLHKDRAPSTYINEAALKRFDSPSSRKGEIPHNAWDDMPEGPHQLLSPQDEWDEYLKLIDDQPIGSTDDPELKIITDRPEVMSFEMSADGTPIGIAYRSPYSKMVVDLVEDRNGRRFAYERVLAARTGAVVIIPIYEGRFVLLEQFRHALRRRQLGFPRGYGELDLSSPENAQKELYEELGVHPISPMVHLGTMVADSGLSGNPVDIFTCSIPRPISPTGYEGIVSARCINPEEMDRLIAEGSITDGFTLSAIAFWKSKHAHT